MNRLKNAIPVVIDALLVMISYWIGLHLRFSVPELINTYKSTIINHIWLILLVKIIIYIVFGLYRIIWSYASIREYAYLTFVSVFANAISIGILLAMKSGIPRGIYPIVVIVDVLCLVGVRIVYRIIRGPSLLINTSLKKRIIIVGAGEAGDLVLREIKRNPTLAYEVIAFVDDDPTKQGRTIHGIRVVGPHSVIGNLVKTYDISEIIIAMPSAPDEVRKKIIEISSLTGAKVRIIPGVYQFMNDSINLEEIKEVSIEDLLRRDPIELDGESLLQFLQDKVVLVTGGGGSIGSELSRQIARYEPKLLILVDIYENSIYDLQYELKKTFPNLNLVVLIDSVRRIERMESIIRKYKPQIVFHAAAHKHVPLMEDSPQSAIMNNVFGTYNLATVSDKYGVKKFVMISTDKAVNPTNVMGTTKRLGEMIIQAFNPISKTDFSAVRFGNVLGSSGSVIPLFRKQIKDGGPITVTHEDINRFFMTIPEAAGLVLQAGSLAKGGEVFILDMGEPVKILDLARDMIRLSGLVEGKDIEIKITGLRPGEKLYEELLLNKETASRTEHNKIWIESPPVMDMEVLKKQLAELDRITLSDDTDALIEYLQQIVTTYHPNRG